MFTSSQAWQVMTSYAQVECSITIQGKLLGKVGIHSQVASESAPQASFNLVHGPPLLT